MNKMAPHLGLDLHNTLKDPNLQSTPHPHKNQNFSEFCKIMKQKRSQTLEVSLLIGPEIDLLIGPDLNPGPNNRTETQV